MVQLNTLHFTHILSTVFYNFKYIERVQILLLWYLNIRVFGAITNTAFYVNFYLFMAGIYKYKNPSHCGRREPVKRFRQVVVSEVKPQGEVRAYVTF